MKRTDITPGQVVSQVTFRDSRQGWPVMVLSTDPYEQDRRRFDVVRARGARLSQGSYSRNAVGLLAVRLSFSMNNVGEGQPMDVLTFRAKAERLYGLASVEHAPAAIEANAIGSEHARDILDDDGTPLGRYVLLTGLQMIAGDYIELTLAERRAEVQRQSYADEAEQARVANVATYRSLADRLDKLGLTGYHCADWESPTRFERVSFGDMERLLDLAESAVRANKAAGIGD